MSSNINNYSTLSNEHDCEDLHICLRNQQTCTSDKHNYVRGGLIPNPVFAYVSM